MTYRFATGSWITRISCWPRLTLVTTKCKVRLKYSKKQRSILTKILYHFSEQAGFIIALSFPGFNHLTVKVTSRSCQCSSWFNFELTWSCKGQAFLLINSIQATVISLCDFPTPYFLSIIAISVQILI